MAGVSTKEDATDRRRRLAEGRGRGVGELPRLERARAEEEQEQAYDEAYADRRLERARAREQQEQAHAEVRPRVGEEQEKAWLRRPPWWRLPSTIRRGRPEPPWA